MIGHQRMVDCLKIYQQKKFEEQGISDIKQQVDILENDETVTTALAEISQIDSKLLPNIISQQFTKITDLEKKVEKAKKSANNAKEKAKNAENKSANLGHKKEAIGALQKATVEIAKSEGDIIDAMNVSFEYQQQLSQITQYLFMLGVSNIAATRTVIQQLRLEVQKAPKEKMSDLAKNEILTVIRQLEAQEDMTAKQEKHAEALKKHKKLIAEGIEKDKEQDAQISENAQNIDELERQDAEQDKLIAEGIQKDKTQDAQISENAQDIDRLEKQGVEQDILIAKGIEKDKQQDRIILYIQDTDLEQDKQITQNRNKNEEQDETLSELIKENKKQGEEILILQGKVEQLQSELSTKDNKMLFTATLIASAGALIIAILQFFF